MILLEEIKDIVAQKYGYEDFNYVRNNLPLAQIVAIMNEVAIEYAKEAVNEFASGITNDINLN